MWAVTAQVHYTDDEGWSHSMQVPTFYLNENVQGILTEEHAARIACEVVNPTGLHKATVTVVKV